MDPLAVLCRNCGQADGGRRPARAERDEKVYGGDLYGSDPARGSGVRVLRADPFAGRYLVRMACGLVCGSRPFHRFLQAGEREAGARLKHAPAAAGYAPKRSANMALTFCAPVPLK